MNTETLLGLGRVVYVNYGPMAGRLAVVVDMVNSKAVVVEGPGLGVSRTKLSNRRLSLTKFRLVGVNTNTKTGELAKQIEKFDLVNRFNQTGLGKKIQKQNRRKELTDFERFQALVLRRQLSRAVRTHVNKNRKNLVA